MTTKHHPTPDDTSTHFLCSGALSWAWYANVDWKDDAPKADPCRPVTWWTLEFDHYNGHITLTHEKIMATVRRLADPESELISARECAQFLLDPEGADFDACSADVVIQQAAFGEVIYG